MAEMDTNAPAIRSVPQGKPPRNPISLKQVESVISRSVAVFGIVFGAQTVPVLLGQIHQAQPIWVIAAIAAVFTTLIFGLLATLAQRYVRIALGLVSIVYATALFTWPFAVIDADLVTPANHWLYLLLTVATATAAIAFRTRIAVAYLCLIPTYYGLVRLTPVGGSVDPLNDLFDVMYSVILGGVIIVIARMLRQAAAAVDTAQAAALARYGHAVRQHATEVERVQVDAIVHDSVLTTLLTAARAYTPEAMALSATNARNAIEHLHAAALVVPDDGTTVRLRDVATRIRDAAQNLTPPFELRLRDIGPQSMPIQAAEAVYSAAMQAMVNSLQHAGKEGRVQRWLSAYGVGVDGIQVEVGDTGEGFLLTSVPQERLGVRVSIMERVAGAGGEAQIDSAPGEGTIVTIRWPAHPTGILAGGDTGSVDVDGRRDVTAADPGIASETRGVTS
jgi:hypothetical protein